MIWFLTDRRGLKDDEVAFHPDVCLTFLYPEEKVYLSLTGRACVRADVSRARGLWNDEQQAWWPGGPDDPNFAGNESGSWIALINGTGRQAPW